MSLEQPETRQRLFFALWPDDEVRIALSQSAVALLGKQTPRVADANLHLTLAFAGAVTAAVRQCLESAAADIRSPAFRLRIDTAGHWPRSRIFWIGPSETPPALWSLASSLRTALAACGLQTETRPYQPHITLSRNIKRVPLAPQPDPVDWSIRHFCLLESVIGPRAASYQILGCWKLED
jgi:2'-5' RNA ligase